MAKPFLELTADERLAAHRVTVEYVGTNQGFSSWDVYLYSLAGREPLAHEAPGAIAGADHDLSGYLETYLTRIGLRLSEPLKGTPARRTARVECI